MEPKTKTYQLGRLNNPRNMTDTEAAYWAAIIDGEGSICITRASMPDQRRPQYRMVLSVANTNMDLLDALARMVGVGGLTWTDRFNEKWKAKGQLIINHEAADFVIRQCYPFLVGKREQAETAMEFMRLKREWSKSNDNHVQQAELYEKSKLLNGRGSAHQKAYTFEQSQPEPTRLCEYEGCSEKHYGNGFCRKHYRWIYEGKTWTPETTLTCKGCGEALPPNTRLTKLYCTTSCKMKYHRAKGCYTAEATSDAPRCSEEGCDRPRQAQGLCRRHYMQKWHAAKKAQVD